MNTINLRCSLDVPNAQSWHFAVKALAMDATLKDIIAESDIFEFIDHVAAYVMVHHSKMHKDSKELFALDKNTRVPAYVMYRTLVHTLKDAWAEQLI